MAPREGLRRSERGTRTPSRQYRDLLQTLLGTREKAPRVGPPQNNVPARPEAGFFGRKRELWDIERWFVGKARRITLTGFGGQGKTALALEAARWLTRTKMFEAAVFVDYSRVQAADALSVAVSNIGSVLGQSLIDANAAREALKQTPTLVVLDNLEAVAAEPLRELLDAAKGWSEAGPSRVLLTTRTPDFGHPDYRVEGTLVHRRIVLEGLGSKRAPDDALEWFAELSKLPPAPTVPTPTRKALIDLFDKVRFHPLSIRTLAAQLKTRQPGRAGRAPGAVARRQRERIARGGLDRSHAPRAGRLTQALARPAGRRRPPGAAPARRFPGRGVRE